MTDVPTPDQAPPVDTGSPQQLGQSPLNSKGEPRRSGPRGGRPRKTPEERAADQTERETQKVTGSRVDPSVTQALQVLNTAYSLIATGLTLVGARSAASELSTKIPAVQAQNRQFLQADLQLAARIAKIGSSTGRAGFLITNLSMLAGVAVTAAAELNFGNSKPSHSTAPPVQSPTLFDPPSADESENLPPAASPLFPGGVSGG